MKQRKPSSAKGIASARRVIVSCLSKGKERPVTRKREFQTDLRGLAIPALVIAFLLQPIVGKWSPTFIVALLTFALVEIFLFEQIVAHTDNFRDRAVSLLPSIILFALFFYFYVLPENARVEANEARCRSIQKEMVSARPRIADAPAKFEAFDCQPAGVDNRIFVQPTDRERAAGKPLPNGGYPPPR